MVLSYPALTCLDPACGVVELLSDTTWLASEPSMLLLCDATLLDSGIEAAGVSAPLFFCICAFHCGV
ncbi:hypothetical protein I7I50_01601 [Histoplasma capsulatum G186AR]|nr:hypothetical protein I7I50_01601 [Histoplasma capsulatum G186AR]